MRGGDRIAGSDGSAPQTPPVGEDGVLPSQRLGSLPALGGCDGTVLTEPRYLG